MNSNFVLSVSRAGSKLVVTVTNIDLTKLKGRPIASTYLPNSNVPYQRKVMNEDGDGFTRKFKDPDLLDLIEVEANFEDGSITKKCNLPSSGAK